jgi:hypothetical protein
MSMFDSSQPSGDGFGYDVGDGNINPADSATYLNGALPSYPEGTKWDLGDGEVDPNALSNPFDTPDADSFDTQQDDGY